MIQLFLYIITIQTSPGPLILLALNSGLQGNGRKTIGFCFGIGLAMATQYISCGFASQLIVTPTLMPWIAGIGGLYIMWLGYHMIKPVETDKEKESMEQKQLTFQQGMIMQLINPKGFVAALPVATIYFPRVGIENYGIIVYSLIFGLLCSVGVLCYTAIGHFFSKWITRPKVLRVCNVVMGMLLFVLAFSIIWEYIISSVKI